MEKDFGTNCSTGMILTWKLPLLRYVYCLAHAINKGWIDAIAYGPVTHLGWHAVAGKINAEGQVEGTCVGTGMAFDPAFTITVRSMYMRHMVTDRFFGQVRK